MPRSVPLLFWDVDTQVDFMRESGKLYVPGAESLEDSLRALTELAREHRIPVVASADDHVASDAEISSEPDWSATYPPHCMSGSEGAEKIPVTRLEPRFVVGHEPLDDAELRAALDADPAQILILKRTTSVFSNPNTEAVLEHLDPRRVVVYGVALDVCNRRAIDGLLSRGYENLALVIDATRAIDPRLGEQLLESWRERGVELITTRQLIEQVERASVSRRPA